MFRLTMQITRSTPFPLSPFLLLQNITGLAVTENMFGVGWLSPYRRMYRRRRPKTETRRARTERRSSRTALKLSNREHSEENTYKYDMRTHRTHKKTFEWPNLQEVYHFQVPAELHKQHINPTFEVKSNYGAQRFQLMSYFFKAVGTGLL